ncbi:MAG: hypothetical protein KDJ36_18020, partial [Hyphomicrobiaceae bacterium]|nr:hypothetical protein [Hyphomicrobiaceae bacterium]
KWEPCRTAACSETKAQRQGVDLLHPWQGMIHVGPSPRLFRKRAALIEIAPFVSQGQMGGSLEARTSAVRPSLPIRASAPKLSGARWPLSGKRPTAPV